METTRKVEKSVTFDSYPAPLEQVSSYTRKYSQTAEVKGHHFTRLVVSLLLKWNQGLSWKTAYRVGAGIGNLQQSEPGECHTTDHSCVPRAVVLDTSALEKPA